MVTAAASYARLAAFVLLRLWRLSLASRGTTDTCAAEGLMRQFALLRIQWNSLRSPTQRYRIRCAAWRRVPRLETAQLLPQCLRHCGVRPTAYHADRQILPKQLHLCRHFVSPGRTVKKLTAGRLPLVSALPPGVRLPEEVSLPAAQRRRQSGDDRVTSLAVSSTL